MPIQTTTDQTWLVDGVPLNSYAWNIATLGGNRFDFPPLRGSNMTLAYRRGQRWRPKVADARTITLLMWVAGVDPTTTGAPGSYGPEQSWRDNWNTLRRLFWTPSRQVTLTRSWKLSDPVTGIPTLITASTKAQLAPVALSTTLTMTGSARADFAVDFILTDPYFYGSPVSTSVPLGSTVSIVNPGDDSALDTGVTLAFTGSMSNVTLTNHTPSPAVSCTAAGSVAGVTLDVDNFTASAGYPLSSITHNGARPWFGLLPGSNSVSLAGTGSGSCTVTFSPPYI